ncbi:MAG: hypothetical protein ACXVFV_04830 [Mycobacteriales bacterium]
MTTSTARVRLLRAAALGAAVAAADRQHDPAAASAALASWRRLRRYADRDSRALLRIAFDTGYGQAMTGELIAAG